MKGLGWGTGLGGLLARLQAKLPPSRLISDRCLHTLPSCVRIQLVRELDALDDAIADLIESVAKAQLSRSLISGAHSAGASFRLRNANRLQETSDMVVSSLHRSPVCTGGPPRTGLQV